MSPFRFHRRAAPCPARPRTVSRSGWNTPTCSLREASFGASSIRTTKANFCRRFRQPRPSCPATPCWTAASVSRARIGWQPSMSTTSRIRWGIPSKRSEFRRMNTSSSFVPRGLFRDREAALANTVVLAWTCAGWLGSFALMGAHAVILNIAGVLLCAHTMIIAAYLVHEAAHQTLFAAHRANAFAGEVMNFIAGSAYASFERIRHMHIRHHLDRADLTCFDFKGLIQGRPGVRRTLQILEWAYVPATEVLMHWQVVARPFFVASQRRHLPRVAAMLIVRGGLLVLLGLWSW